MTATRDTLTLLALLGMVAALVTAASVWQAASRVEAQSGLFLVLSPDTEAAQSLALRNGGRPVGLQSAPLATLIEGTAATFAALRQNGAWILPAAGLDFLCAPNDR